MNWLDFRSNIINCHVEVAIIVVSFFFLLHVQGLFFLDSLVISTILKPRKGCMNFNNNFFYIFMA